MRSHFVRAYPPAQADLAARRWLLFRGGELVVLGTDGQAAFIEEGGQLDLAEGTPLYLGALNDVAYTALELAPDAPLPPGARTVGLRALYGQLGDEEFSIAGYASQMLLWRRSSRFCPVCGAPTEPVGGDWGRRCSSCGFARYPQISPATLALVHDGEQVLLTHKPGWGPMYSIIAGFVEPNESLEACVHREVLEEVGVEIDTVIYGGSQGWPFPAQLMVGFSCRYAGGALAIDTQELDDARWFHVDSLPPLPGKISLSRQLLDAWIRSQGRETPL
ncbi:MAG: NAD(+) diphosphatase [Roseiflexaceae bacterium]|nr:NAD(+) diphosphatase [Roseiflexaceae bacterium]